MHHVGYYCNDPLVAPLCPQAIHIVRAVLLVVPRLIWEVTSEGESSDGDASEESINSISPEDVPFNGN
jgi:hypothetical protein